MMTKKGIKRCMCLVAASAMMVSSMTALAEKKSYEYSLKGGAASSNMSSASKGDGEQIAYVTASEYFKPYNVRVRYNGAAATELKTISKNGTVYPAYSYLTGVKGKVYNLYANSERASIYTTKVYGRWNP